MSAVKQQPKIAIVHDFLSQMGGAEQVLLALLEIYPQAPVYTLVYDKDKAQKMFGKYDIRPSFINKLPGGIKYYRAYLPLMPKAIESFDLSDYDIVLSEASAFAKGVITGPQTLHFCYLHTPTRYLWKDFESYTNEARDVPGLAKSLVRAYLRRLRGWDLKAAARPDIIFGNSKTIAALTQKYYHRQADYIYPFADTDKFTPEPEKLKKARPFYFMSGRLVPYKRVDLAVEAFGKLGLPLKIAGSGIDFERIKKLADPYKNIELLGRVSDEKLHELYATCAAYIFPPEEDFGITPVEAMSCGRPVIAYGKGGATETVVDGKTGILFTPQTPKALIEAIRKAERIKFDAGAIRRHSLQFSKERFKKEIAAQIKTAYVAFKKD